MKTHVPVSAGRQTKQRRSRAIQQPAQSAVEPEAVFENNRADAVAQRHSQALMANSLKVVRGQALKAMSSSALQTEPTPTPPLRRVANQWPLRNWLAGAADPTGAGVTLADLGPGVQLDSGTAARMSAAFGGERFDGVRIHTGAVAASKVRELGADAMAVGSHMAFASGEYRPGTPSGDGLIAHELAHVMQQRGGEPLTQRRVAEVESDDLPHERDAENVASAVVSRLHPEKATDAASWDIAAPIRPALATGLGVRRGKRPDMNALKKNAARIAVEKGAVTQPEGLSEQERQTAIGEACDSMERAAPALLQAEDSRFKNWSMEQIAKDDRMRDWVETLLADDNPLWGDGNISYLLRSGICADKEQARQEILAAYDSRHKVHKAVARIKRADPPKLAGYSFRHYDRRYQGKDALIAHIIRLGAEYTPASYPRECVDHVIEKMADLDPPDQTVEEILANSGGAYYQEIIKAYNRRVEATSGAKGMGTQLGNATGAHYSGVMAFK